MDAIHNVTSPSELTGKTPVEKSKLYLGLPAILSTVPVNETGESLVGENILAASGLRITPFWIDDPHDMEGMSYHAYIASRPDFELLVRASVATRLAQAQAILPANWQIVLKAGYRPLSVQQDLFKRARAMLKKAHSDWDSRTLLAQTRILVSDPRVRIPPHTTGGAIDIELFDTNTKELVDMGARANTEGEAGWTYSSVITKEQQHRRLLLLDAMLAAGFANYVYEWWHFSYGDQMWALFHNKPATLYDIIHKL